MEKYRNSALPAHERAMDLLSRMTFAEKVAQMMQLSLGHISWEEAELWAKERGIGSFLHAVGDDVCRLQGFARESRLGIPLIMGIDAIHGHAIHNGDTVFPTPLALACAFSADLAREVAAATAREVALDGLHWVFSPLLCQARDLRWGRVGETFGEDPYLIGELATAMVKGYQGKNLSDPTSVLSCLKHYIAYGESTGGRDSYDAPISCRMVRETFLPPFAKAVQAGAATVMSAYHSVDSVPCTINHKLLNQMLREELGFDGVLTTDWNNVENLVTLQHVCSDLQEAALKAISTTHDIIMTTPGFYDAALALHQQGRLKDDALDASVIRLLTKKIELGLLDSNDKMPSVLRPPSLDMLEAHEKLALDAAEQGMVLLKNQDGLLPLREVHTLALVGPASDSARTMFGDWTFFTHPEPDENRKPVKRISTFKDGLQEACTARWLQLIHHKGCDFLGKWQDIAGAVKAVQKADVIIVCLGDCLAQLGETHDRSDLRLSGGQNELIEAMAQTGKPVIGVFTGSKPLALGRMVDASQALICALSPGERGGEALANLLFGDVSFTGRLPISFPYATGQLPVYYNGLPGWHGGKYMDCPSTPLFAFGEGMGYTTFQYGDLKATPAQDGVLVDVSVTNTGRRKGTETVQCYVWDVVASLVRPVRKLAGFAKVSLAPGEAKAVTIFLPFSAFTLVDENEQTILEEGEFEIQVGPSSREETLLRVRVTL